MANAPISGLTADITFAGGYTTNGFMWVVNHGAAMNDNTPFTPADNFRTRTAATPLLDWGGRYVCHYPVTSATTIAGPAYLAYPVSYNLRLTSEVLEDTAFTDTARSYTAGLLDASGSYDVIVDTDTEMPVAGTAANGVFTIGVGVSYTIPLIVGDCSVNVSADGSQRLVSASFAASAATTVAGAAPLPGVSGAATFTAAALQTYAGNIIVTSVEVSMDAQRETGQLSFEFVGDGVCTPA